MNADGTGQTRHHQQRGDRRLPRLVAGRDQDRLREHPPRQQFRDLHDERGRRERDPPHNRRMADFIPAWSPDGTALAYRKAATSRMQPGAIYKVSVSGGRGDQPHQQRGGRLQPRLVAGRSKVMFSTVVNGNHEVYTMGLDGTNRTNISNHPAHDSDPTMGPIPIPGTPATRVPRVQPRSASRSYRPSGAALRPTAGTGRRSIQVVRTVPAVAPYHGRDSGCQWRRRELVGVRPFPDRGRRPRNPGRRGGCATHARHQ